MTTVLKGMHDLAGHFGLKPKQNGDGRRQGTATANGSGNGGLLPGMVLAPQYDPNPALGRIGWVKNAVLQFGNCKNGGYHPAVMVGVNRTTAVVCPMTSKIKGKGGFVYEIEATAGLSSRRSKVLTKPSLRSHIPLIEFVEVGRMGPRWRSFLSGQLLSEHEGGQVDSMGRRARPEGQPPAPQSP